MAKIGIPALDRTLAGALPRGFTILVSGSPGSGTELFAKQFSAGGNKEENIVYISTSERDEDLITTMEQFGWKPEMRIVNIGTKYYESVLAKELEISKYRQEGVGISDIKDYAKKKPENRQRKKVNFLTVLAYEVLKTKPPFRIIIDSLDFFMQHYDDQQVISTLQTIRAHAQHYESVILMTMMKSVYAARTQSEVEGIVDCIIEFETKRTATEFEKYLLITKVRNHPEKAGVMKYTITDDGISLFR